MSGNCFGIILIFPRSVLGGSIIVMVKRLKKGRGRQSASARAKQKYLQLRIQALIGVLSLIVIAGLGLVDRVTFATLTGSAKSSIVHHDIALEYPDRASAVFTLARKGHNALLIVQNDSSLPLKVSLPDVWSIAEAQAADLQTLKETSDVPTTSYTRWVLPSKARITFTGKSVPTSLTFVRNRSDRTAAITLHTIDLLSDVRNSRVLLLQESTLAEDLWGE